MLVTEEGVFVASMEEYLADPCPTPSVSASVAKSMMGRSPAHAFVENRRLNPYYETEESNKFDIGTAFHTLMTGVGGELQEVVGYDNWKKKDAQQTRAELKSMGIMPLLSHEMLQVEHMADAAKFAFEQSEFGNPFADHDPRTCEVNMAWRSNTAYGPVWNRARSDKLDMENRICFDLKTTTDATEGSFSRVIQRLSYDMTRVHYLEGLNKIFPGRPWRHVFAVTETEAPHGSRMIELSAPDWDIQAEPRLNRARDRFAWCMKNDVWPGYPTDTMKPEPAPYYTARLEFEAEKEAAELLKKPGQNILDMAAKWQAPTRSIEE